MLTLPDIPAGSDAERSLVSGLSEKLTSTGFSVKVTPVEVLEWRELECLLEDKYACTALPPVESAELSGTLGKEITILSTTRDPDNIWTLYRVVSRRGASAVIFYDEYPEVSKRRIVVSEVPSLSPYKRMVARVPAVHVPLKTLPALRRRREISLSVRTTTRVSIGYIIDASIREEPGIAVTAHHDRWLSGFRDNAAGIITLLKLAEYSSRARIPLRIISFTAEEFGDPRLGAFYWAYGSRTYLKSASNDLSLVVTLDTAFKEPVEIDYIGIEGFEKLLSSLVVLKTDVGIGYTDSVSAVSYGIPAAALHNLSSMKPLYHSDADRYPGRSFDATALRIARAMASVVSKLADDRLMEALLKSYIERVRRALPAGLRTLLDIDADPWPLSRCLLKHFTLLAIEGTYDDVDTQVKLFSLPDLLRKIEEGGEVTIINDDSTLSRESINLLLRLSRELLDEAILCAKR